eukprot:6491124-Amphidinium_carterae.1
MHSLVSSRAAKSRVMDDDPSRSKRGKMGACAKRRNRGHPTATGSHEKALNAAAKSASIAKTSKIRGHVGHVTGWL